MKFSKNFVDHRMPLQYPKGPTFTFFGTMRHFPKERFFSKKCFFLFQLGKIWFSSLIELERHTLGVSKLFSELFINICPGHMLKNNFSIGIIQILQIYILSTHGQAGKIHHAFTLHSARRPSKARNSEVEFCFAELRLSVCSCSPRKARVHFLSELRLCFPSPPIPASLGCRS